MAKYFISADGVVQGQVFTDNPANPLGYSIVELETVPENTQDYRYRNGAFVEADPFKDYGGNIGEINRVVFAKRERVSKSVIDRVLSYERPGMWLVAAESKGYPVGIVVENIRNDGSLPTGSVLNELKALFADAAKNGFPVFGHLSAEETERLAAIYVDLKVQLNKLADGTYYAVYDPDVVVGAASVAARKAGVFSDIVQRHLDRKAQDKGYDNIVSACSYAGAPNPFQAESQAFLDWRSAVWQHCYQVLADVAAGVRAEPTEAQLLAELPALVLPS